MIPGVIIIIYFFSSCGGYADRNTNFTGVTRFASTHGQTRSRLHCSSCSNVKVMAKVTINLSNENDVIIHVTSVDWWTFLINRNSQHCKRGEFFLSRQLQSCSFSNMSFSDGCSWDGSYYILNIMFKTFCCSHLFYKWNTTAKGTRSVTK